MSTEAWRHEDSVLDTITRYRWGLLGKTMKPVISVVFGSYNRKRYLRATLDNVREHGMDVPYEIIVVDGGSTDGALAYLTRQKDVITIVQHNRGVWRGKAIERKSWGYFMNLGFKAAQGKYVCMISDDCLLVPGAIMNGYRLFEEQLEKGKKTGAVAFYYRERPALNDSYFVSRIYGTIFVNHGLYLKKALEDVGYIDEDTFFFYAADADLCLRMAQEGYTCIDSPDSYVEHHRHANLTVRKSNREIGVNDKQALLERWGHLDPTLSTYEQVHTAQYRDYDDPAHTARTFRRIDRWDVVLFFRTLRDPNGPLMRLVKSITRHPAVLRARERWDIDAKIQRLAPSCGKKRDDDKNEVNKT